MFAENAHIASSQDIGVVIVAIFLSFILSSAIAYIYKKTHHGLSYSRSFVFTLVLVSVLSALVMMIVENSVARAFAILGTFTIIRFRTAIKDTKDTAFILWTIVIGLAVGTANYSIAIIGTVTIAGIVAGFSKIDFGSLRNYDHILRFFVSATASAEESYKVIFEKYIKKSILLHARSRDDGKSIEYTYNVTFHNEESVSSFLLDLEGLKGLSRVDIVVSKDDIEY
jgi:hypothetical protein